jgi:antitoxin ParD1/3/4
MRMPEPEPDPDRATLAKIAIFCTLYWVRRGVHMPSRNVNLTDALGKFVSAKIESGRYDNASEVVRAGLRILEREEQKHEATLAALRKAIDEGDGSGIYRGDPFSHVRQRLNLAKKGEADKYSRRPFPTLRETGAAAHRVQQPCDFLPAY